MTEKQNVATTCPQCGNSKNNYIQEGQNRCNVCAICWPIDKSRAGQIVNSAGEPIKVEQKPLIGYKDDGLYPGAYWLEKAYETAQEAQRAHLNQKLSAMISDLVPKDEIWFINPATLEIVGKITGIGDE